MKYTHYSITHTSSADIHCNNPMPSTSITGIILAPHPPTFIATLNAYSYCLCDTLTPHPPTFIATLKNHMLHGNCVSHLIRRHSLQLQNSTKLRRPQDFHCGIYTLPRVSTAFQIRLTHTFSILGR